MTVRTDKDPLGTRMKEQYENRTRFLLPRRTYTVLRLDGKAFHTYTRGLKKPFDGDLIADIDAAILNLLPELQGAVFAYTQSDEISVLLTDFATLGTSAWFDGNLQKMVSVAASVMTAEFNKQRFYRHTLKLKSPMWDMENMRLAYFDCRAFTVPDRTEVMNTFRWRQQDCVRNSVSMVAQVNFSHKELNGKSQSDMHEMLHTKGVNWATDFSDGEKNGRIIFKENYVMTVPPEKRHSDLTTTEMVRSRWVSKGAWVFTQDEGKLLNMIPKYVD
jgi:tRNA(His) guanylyltransferase